MLFEFLNVEGTADKLLESSKTFAAEYPTQAEAIRYLKERAVVLYGRAYADVKTAEDVADGVLQVPIWKGVGVTFCALRAPNPPRGEDWPVNYTTPGAVYVEVNFWMSLPIN